MTNETITLENLHKIRILIRYSFGQAARNVNNSKDGDSMMDINTMKSIKLVPPILMAIDVPQEFWLVDDVSILAIIELDSPTPGKRLPRETDAFHALTVFAGFAREWGLSALLGSAVKKVCVDELSKIPANKCWGFVKLRRKEGMTLVGMFNRGKLTQNAEELVRRAWQGFAGPRLLNRIDWDWWDGDSSAKKSAAQHLIFAVKPDAWDGRKVQDPTVIACCNRQSRQVIAAGIVLPDEPQVIRFPVRFSANTLRSLIVTVALKKTPGDILSVVELDTWLQKAHKFHDKTYIANTMQLIAQQLPIFERTASQVAQYRLTFRKVCSYALQSTEGSAAEILSRI